MATTMLSSAPTTFACMHCSASIEVLSKFCGNCGAPRMQSHFGQGSFDPTISKAAIRSSNAINERVAQSTNKSTPAFAKNKRQNRSIPPEMRAEMASLMAAELRERIFLVLHYIVFLVTNMIGLFITVKCYVEFAGDELAKMMIAATPLMFINLVALCGLVPIKGTKKEIARIKERMTYLKLAMEFDSIV